MDKDKPLNEPGVKWVCGQCGAYLWTFGEPPSNLERHNVGCPHVLATWIEHPFQGDKFTDEQLASFKAEAPMNFPKLSPVSTEATVRDPRKKDKPRISLVPPSLIFAVAEVFTKGAHGRPDFDWLHPPKSYSESLDAVERHILAYRDGHTVDEKTGLNPLWHAAARLSMVIEYEHLGLDNNDLYKHQTEQQKVHPLPAEWEATRDILFRAMKELQDVSRGVSILPAVQKQAVSETIESIRILLGVTHD